MQFKVDKLHVGNSVLLLVYLSKLSDVVKSDVVKEDVYNAKTKDIENKISDIFDLATNIARNARINEVKNETSSITNLATPTALTAGKKEIPDHSKYITSSEFNKITAETFTAILK